MYENLIRRPSSASPKQPFSIRLDPIAVHKKVAYIDSVCAALIESRFGPGWSTPFDMDLRESPDREPAIFYDLTIDGLVPCYTILSDSEVARRCMADAVRRELAQADIASVVMRVQTRSPSTLGRGSPKYLRHAGKAGPNHDQSRTTSGTRIECRSPRVSKGVTSNLRADSFAGDANLRHKQQCPGQFDL